MDANKCMLQMDANKLMPNNGCQKTDAKKRMPKNGCQEMDANKWMRRGHMKSRTNEFSKKNRRRALGPS